MWWWWLWWWQLWYVGGRVVGGSFGVGIDVGGNCGIVVSCGIGGGDGVIYVS